MSIEQRRFFRCPLSGERSVGVLIVGARRLPCVIRNRSIGGFGVEVTNDPMVAKVSNALLESREGTFPVQIVHANLFRGRLSLGLEERPEEPVKSGLSAQQVRQLSFTLGTVAILFLIATMLLAWHAERAADWLERASWSDDNVPNRVAVQSFPGRR